MRLFLLFFVAVLFIQCGGNDKDDPSKDLSVTKDRVDKWDKAAEASGKNTPQEDTSTTKAVFYLEAGNTKQTAEVTWINKTVISVNIVSEGYGNKQLTFSAVLTDVPHTAPQIFVDEKGSLPVHSFMQQTDDQKSFIRVDVSLDKKFIVLIDWTTNGQQELGLSYNQKMLRKNQ